MARIQKRPVEVEVRRAEPGEEIKTREGTLNAQEGDLIIEGVEGEVYPIGPEILAQTYAPSDEEAMELYRECLPEGVVVEFEDMGNVTVAHGIYVDLQNGDLSEAERENAEVFVRRFMETAPHLRDDGEIAYSGRF